MPEETASATLFEIIRTTRSMRRLKPYPVPNDLIPKILEAGVCAEASQASPVTTTVNSTSPTWNTQRRAGGDYHPQRWSTR